MSKRSEELFGNLVPPKLPPNPENLSIVQQIDKIQEGIAYIENLQRIHREAMKDLKKSE